MTVESALAQTRGDFELLLSDDGSTDNTLEVARQWQRRDSRVRVLNGPNGGTSTARNRALRVARGSYFALLDSDDLWEPDYLAAQLAVFADHPEADVVTANAYNLGGPFDGLPLKPTGGGCRKLSMLDIIEHEDAVCITSVFRRRIFDRLGGFDPHLWYCEDYEYWVRAAHAGFVFFVNPAPHARYRRRADSKSAEEAAHFDGVIRVYQHIRRFWPHPCPEREAIDRQISRFERQRLLDAAKTHLLRRNFGAAAVDFERLAAMRNDVASGVIAGVGRRLPQAILWAYHVKSAFRTLRRAHHGV
jgi:glycosyltransferase involved in cell wall biosynthesis